MLQIVCEHEEDLPFFDVFETRVFEGDGTAG